MLKHRPFEISAVVVAMMYKFWEAKIQQQDETKKKAPSPLERGLFNIVYALISELPVGL
jgi:hypothetical protein